MSLSALPKDIHYQLFQQMDYSTILNFCQSNRQWYNFCRQPRIQKLIKVKYEEKLNRDMTADDLFLWKVIEDVKNMDYDQQVEYLEQYPSRQIELLYNTFKKWYSRLFELLNRTESIEDDDYYSDDSDSELYQPAVFSQLPDNGYRDFILDLMSLGKRNVINFLEMPVITFSLSPKKTSLIYALYDRIVDFY